MKDVKLEYALKNGKLVSIYEVEKGLDCGCICPHCKEPLIAKQGACREFHFAHLSGNICELGYQKSIHLLAIKILNECKEITLPSVPLPIKFSNHTFSVIDKTHVKIDHIETEKKVNDIIPDLIAYINGRPLLIEICVTHKVDSNKLRKIQNSNLPAIEIKLSQNKSILSEEEFKKLLIYETHNKLWLNNPKANKYYEKFIKASEKLPLYSIDDITHAKNCPKQIRYIENEYYANLYRDCVNCKYSLGFDAGNVYCNYNTKLFSIEDVNKKLEESC
ncbi:MAG: hypothetical protein IKJ30_01285 [Bacilli bacterium]|nr:hypothetical protein [Bacilli bacterium]